MLKKHLTKLFAISLLSTVALNACATANKTPVSQAQPSTASLTSSNDKAPNDNSKDVAASQKTTIDLAQYAKPAVVRIQNGCFGTASFSRNNKTYELSAGSLGSGFFVNPNGYIVTNAHVTLATQNPEECEKLLYNSYVQQIAQDYQAAPQEVYNDEKVFAEFKQSLEYKPINNVILANGKRLPFEVKQAGKPVGEGKDVSIIKVETKNAPVLKLGNSDEVKDSDPIKAFGYPGSADSDVLNENSLYKATTSSGEISSTTKKTQEGSPVLQINASVTHGSSGGPVVNREGEVIGIVTFGGNPVNGQENFNSAFAVPSNTIMEFVKQAGITNEEGLVNQIYREGLQLYNQGQYNQAMEKFEQVKRLFPEHSQIDELIQESQEKTISRNSLSQ